MRQAALAHDMRAACEKSDGGLTAGVLVRHSHDYRPCLKVQGDLPLSYRRSRYCDQPMDWRTRLAGLCCTAAIFLLIVAGAAFTWRAVQPMIAPSAPVVVNLRSFEAPPEPVREVPDGPEQAERQEVKPEPEPDAVVPSPLVRLPAPPIAVLELPEPAVETIDPGPPVPETMAPRSIAAPEGQQISSNAEATWEALLLSHLEKFRRYPARARAGKYQGIAYIRFQMNRAGSVLSAEVLRSSGVTLLDRAALDTLRRAQPLPAIPKDKPGVLELTVPVAFFVR